MAPAIIAGSQDTRRLSAGIEIPTTRAKLHRGVHASASPKKQVRFEGKCDNCGKVGHKKAQCWQPSGGKGKGGDKQKGKQKGSANSLDNPEPEPPADAGGLDLCTITSSPTPSRTSRVSTSRMSRVTDIPFFEEEGEESRAASDREASVASTVNSLDEGWIKCNLDTGASVTVFPRRMFNNVDEPNDVRLKTASGEIIRGLELHPSGARTRRASGAS